MRQRPGRTAPRGVSGQQQDTQPMMMANQGTPAIVGVTFSFGVPGSFTVLEPSKRVEPRKA